MTKAPVRWFWRPAVWPVWNHHIHRPVRIWSPEGPNEQVLQALAHRAADHLRLPAPTPAEWREQVSTELAASSVYLRQVQDRYWDRDWRRAHTGFGIYPEHHLWDAVWGYLDLLEAAQQRGIDRPEGAPSTGYSRP